MDNGWKRDRFTMLYFIIKLYTVTVCISGHNEYVLTQLEVTRAQTDKNPVNHGVRHMS